MGDVVIADVIIGDKQAQEDLENGIKELSPGYDFASDAQNVTVGPLRVNHIALVERGRSGPNVRVLDGENKSMPMDKEMRDAIKDAVSAALADGKMEKGFDADSVSDKVMDKLKPWMAKADAATAAADAATKAFADAKKVQDEATTAANLVKATDEAKVAATKLEETVRKEERARFKVVADVMPLIPEDKRDGMEDADVKTLLLAAVGDSVPNAKDMSVDFLHGRVSAMREKLGDVAPAAGRR